MRHEEDTHPFGTEYARGLRRKSADSLDLRASDLGQNCSTRCPDHCPQHCPDVEGEGFAEELGEPISIQAVARLIGCSVWTVRQRYLPAGLPHLRMRAQGKLFFYRTQIIRWLLDRQQKGGTIT
jgi:hypothetical protein